MKALTLSAFLLCSSCQAAFVPEFHRGQKSTATLPLTASFLNEPFAGENPVFSKMRETKVYSPSVAVEAEGGDVMTKDKATKPTRRPPRIRTVKWESIKSNKIAVEPEGGDVKHKKKPTMSAVSASPTSKRAVKWESAGIEAEGKDTKTFFSKTTATQPPTIVPPTRTTKYEIAAHSSVSSNKISDTSSEIPTADATTMLDSTETEQKKNPCIEIPTDVENQKAGKKQNPYIEVTPHVEEKKAASEEKPAEGDLEIEALKEQIEELDKIIKAKLYEISPPTEPVKPDCEKDNKEKAARAPPANPVPEAQPSKTSKKTAVDDGYSIFAKVSKAKETTTAEKKKDSTVDASKETQMKRESGSYPSKSEKTPERKPKMPSPTTPAGAKTHVQEPVNRETNAFKEKEEQAVDSVKTVETVKAAEELTAPDDTTASHEDHVACCYVSKSRKFVAGADVHTVSTSSCSSFVAGQSSSFSGSRTATKESTHSSSSSWKGVPRGSKSEQKVSSKHNSSGSPGTAKKHYPTPDESIIFCQAVECVGAALNGAGDALVSDTKFARKTFVSWMMLYPAWSVLGGNFRLFGQLMVSAMVALIVRNANKVQEAVDKENKFFDAAQKYEEDGWWGDGSRARNSRADQMRRPAAEMDDYEDKMDEDVKPRMRKLVTKCVKRSLINDILGKRSFYQPQIYVAPEPKKWSNYISEEDNVRKVRAPYKKVAKRIHVDKTERNRYLVAPLESETSRTEFQNNYMLDISRLPAGDNLQVPKRKLKKEFLNDIRGKRKIFASNDISCFQLPKH